jgi:hypothetical protein
MEQPLPFKMLAFLTILMMTTAAAAVVSPAVALPPLQEQAATLLAWKATLSNQSQHTLQSWRNTSVPCVGAAFGAV